MRNIVMVMLLVLTSGRFVVHSVADTLITPDDSRINYYGRFDQPTAAMKVFAWPGCAIEANLPGPVIGCKLVDGKGDYNVVIDGVLDTIIVMDKTRDIIFGTDYSEELHHVRITLRNEHHYNTGSFRGFYLADGKEPGPAPEVSLRKIEFIGDSYTAGYGIESDTTECDESLIRHTTNVTRTFAALVTDAFHAQSTILAWSGAGMVRNYAEETQRGQTPYPSRYSRTLSSADGMKWKFSRWMPHLVILCLGTNDYSTEPVPDDSMFIGDYHDFIAEIIGNYPDAAICCVGTHDSLLREKVRIVVTEEQDSLGHSQVFGAQFPDSMELSACHYHPTISDNERIAAMLIDTVKSRLGWDTSLTAVAQPERRMSAAAGDCSFRVTCMQEYITISDADGYGIKPTIQIVTPRGQLVQELNVQHGGKYVCAVSKLSPGMYLVGSRLFGWHRVLIKR